MAIQDDIKILEEGLKIAYENNKIDEAKKIGAEIIRLQKELDIAAPTQEIQLQIQIPLFIPTI